MRCAPPRNCGGPHPCGPVSEASVPRVSRVRERAARMPPSLAGWEARLHSRGPGQVTSAAAACSLTMHSLVGRASSQAAGSLRIWLAGTLAPPTQRRVKGSFHCRRAASWNPEPFCPGRRDAGPTLRFMGNLSEATLARTDHASFGGASYTSPTLTGRSGRRGTPPSETSFRESGHVTCVLLHLTHRRLLSHGFAIHA